ncbi:Sestrin-1 [Perkinsus chesapeaki]|uniref:Sestrin-1 n=1 Tax=Perkinsus chesapeaki TaxID=330153 RepID=A0A7J6N2Y2_PERCH|nr:Sestrin-1 [Perkinsus chesapeaki]
MSNTDVAAIRVTVQRLRDLQLAIDAPRARLEAFQDITSWLRSLANARRTTGSAHAELDQAIRILLRLKYTCRFPDIRNAADNFLAAQRNSGIAVAARYIDTEVSRFSKNPHLISVPPVDWSLFDSSSAARITHLDWALSTVPRFFVNYSRTMDVLMFHEGGLQLHWRHFIAMMAASRHNCEYLVRNQIELFLASGGDINWLTDPTSVPKQLRALHDVNLILCHKPWDLTQRHMEDLLQVWSKADLVVALAILSTFHTLPVVAFGLGLEVEPDLRLEPGEIFFDDPPYDPDMERMPSCFLDNTGSVPFTAQRLIEHADRGSDDESESHPSIEYLTKDPITREDSHPSFGKLSEHYWMFGSSPKSRENDGSRPVSSSSHSKTRHTGGKQQQSAEPSSQASSTSAIRLSEGKKSNLSLVMNAYPRVRAPSCRRFRHPPHSPQDNVGEMEDCGQCGKPLHYFDFDVRGSKGIPWDSQFSWDEQARVLMNHLLLDGSLTDSIDREYMEALESATDHIGPRSVPSTLPLRQAILVYVHQMYGIAHHDYDYTQQNKFLTLLQKVVLKKLVCYPERFSKADFGRFMKIEQLELWEMADYVYLIFQARRVVELTYALRALNNAMSALDGQLCPR